MEKNYYPLKIYLDKELYEIYLKWAEVLTANCVHTCSCCYNDPKKEKYVGKETYNYFSVIGEEGNKFLIAHSKIPLKQSEKKPGELVCTHYDEGKERCLIHETKPFGCRLFPLTVDFDSNLTFDPEFIYDNFCRMKIDLEKLRQANEEIQEYIKKEARTNEYKPR